MTKNDDTPRRFTKIMTNAMNEDFAIQIPYLRAMRADSIPEAGSNLWYIQKRTYNKPVYGDRSGKLVGLPAATYTYLFVITDSTLYQGGALVMEDTNYELKTHLGFVMNAYGKVLVTGLGLGCVVRGLLLNQKVEHVTVIENSPDVLKMVAPHMPKERLTIIEADALEWTARNQQPFDCGWHDLWTDQDKGEPHLDVWHAQLFANCKKAVKRQGAWAFNRSFKEKLLREGFPWIG